MSAVVLRTHGGLGNQLFQVFYGRLLAEEIQFELREVHDLRYQHKFERVQSIAIAPAPSKWQCAVSSLRVPKVYQKLTRWQERPWKFGPDCYLDGYFQDDRLYRRFSDEAIRRQLRTLAEELGIRPAVDDDWLVHLRVGDFFGDRCAARRHIVERLGDIPYGAALITNDEALLRDAEVAALMSAKHAQLISTEGFAAQDVLRTLSRHRKVNANDSTLAVWAHVLAGTQVNFQEIRLSKLASYLGSFGPWR